VVHAVERDNLIDSVDGLLARRVDISLQEEWGQRAPRTQIVAIGAAETIDASLMEKTFTFCILAQPCRQLDRMTASDLNRSRLLFHLL
jgi:hypothetical protein